MNCFNIREYESLLKRKFFKDLINVTDNHNFLNKVIVSLRFKNNNNMDISPDQNIYYNYSLTTLPKTKHINLETKINYLSTKLNNINNNLINYFLFTNFFEKRELLLNNIFILISSINSLISKLHIYSVFLVNFSVFKSVILLNFNISFNIYEMFFYKNTFTKNLNTENIKLESINTLFLKNNLLFNESNKNYRFIRYYNPLISYDYKTGHYMGI
jgi:hypothetical protein